MYRLDLAESPCPVQLEVTVLDLTVGGVLRATALRTPDAIALVETNTDGKLGRRWTYAKLLADSERLAQAVLSRCQPGERIAVQGG